ncbi:ATP-binding protein [Rhodoferax sp.]|uniref:sensor histidine kinase n=1 Tax=Rhodoferax sp. TaxID=50421 RepID=UPI00261C06A3|nr:ATP-binding protein [Rhodoferax sp.]MDD2926615.1 ATP-binding protein [Rhodoferax sp.]
MKNFLNAMLPVVPFATEEEQDIKHKVVFLNNVFSFAGVVAFGMGFVRWQESALMGLIDFGFAGLSLALLLYLRNHREAVERIAFIALTLAAILFFAIYLLAPHNTTRSSLFLLLTASAVFLKGRRAGLVCLFSILLFIVSVSLFSSIATAYSHIDMLTMSVYLIALFFIFERYDTVKVEQKERLQRLNAQLEEKVQARTRELQQANQRLEQLNEDLDRKVKERTQQLLATQEELVRQEKLAVLGQVAGSVGHELRNPLSVMSNAVFFLQTVLADADETTKEYLDIIKSEIAGSERIVSDLLDSVRTKPPHPETVGVRELIDQTLRKFSMPPAVTIKLDIPESLPPLRVDPLQVQQVLRNLISNGVEAMPDGGTLEIRAAKDLPSGTVTIGLRDTGTGIAPEVLSKLFQPLFTTKARGIGLGLVVVKNLTEANGGSVAVQSEPGKGSTFVVTLPCGTKECNHVA